MPVDTTRLRRDLSAESDVHACARTVCRHLGEAGHVLTSVYAERSGVLRCLAAAGYWQVRDGFPVTTGIIGATVRSGMGRLVETATSDLYVAAVPGVVAEACAPVLVGGRAVGAVDIESTSPLEESALADATAAAGLLAERVAALDGFREPSGWRLIVDAAARLQNSADPGQIVGVALETSRQLVGGGSSAVVLGAGRSPRVEAALGPLAEQLYGLTPAALTRLARLVQGNRTCVTIGPPEGRGFTGRDSLKTAGALSLWIVALTSGDENLGFLLVVDTLHDSAVHETVEQLDVLAALVGAALVNVRRLRELIEQSSRDPLTGLGHSRAFGDRLREAQRATRTLHAVMSIDIDNFKAINDSRGHAVGDQVLKAVADAMTDAVRDEDTVFRTGGDEFAAILAVRSGEEALAVAERLQAAARRTGVDVSIGIALTAPGVDESGTVFARADDALYEVKRSGRGAVRLAEPAPPVVRSSGRR